MISLHLVQLAIVQVCSLVEIVALQRVLVETGCNAVQVFRCVHGFVELYDMVVAGSFEGREGDLLKGFGVQIFCHSECVAVAWHVELSVEEGLERSL